MFGRKQIVEAAPTVLIEIPLYADDKPLEWYDPFCAPYGRAETEDFDAATVLYALLKHLRLEVRAEVFVEDSKTVGHNLVFVKKART